jgi:citrate/tricarballylate utilization protein
MFVGCIGLLVLKRQSSNVTTSPQAKESEYHLLVALAFLGASGLATLLTRTTSVYGIVLLIHLASVAMAFAAAPYTRFAHVTYRSLALLRDNLEIAA